MQFLVYCGPNL